MLLGASRYRSNGCECIPGSGRCSILPTHNINSEVTHVTTAFGSVSLPAQAKPASALQRTRPRRRMTLHGLSLFDRTRQQPIRRVPVEWSDCDISPLRPHPLSLFGARLGRRVVHRFTPTTPISHAEPWKATLTGARKKKRERKTTTEIHCWRSVGSRHPISLPPFAFSKSNPPS